MFKLYLLLAFALPLFSQRLTVPERSLAQGAVCKGLSPLGDLDTYITLPEIDDSESGQAPLVLIELVAGPAGHTLWTDYKLGYGAKFRLPKGLRLSVQYLKGRLGHEGSFVFSKRF
jgi:hypothetical protein